MKFREVLFFSRTFFLPKRLLNLFEYTIKEHFDERETLPSSSLPRPPTRRVVFGVDFSSFFDSRAYIYNLCSFLIQKLMCSHVCVFFSDQTCDQSYILIHL